MVKINTVKVKILIPHAEGLPVDPRVLDGLKTFRGRKGFEFEIITQPNSNIVQARNNLLWGSDQNVPFANDGAHFFLFVDSDTEGTFDDFYEMFKLGEPLVFGAYPHKRAGNTDYFVGGGFIPGFPGCAHRELYTPRTEGGIVEVDWAGFGFCLIRADVLTRIPYPWIELRTVDAPPEYLRGREIPYEDVCFCIKAREAGYKILLDCRLNLKHHTRGAKMTGAEKIPEGMSEMKDNSDQESVAAISLITQLASRIRFLSENIRLYSGHIAEKDAIIEGLQKEITALKENK
jgi:hypothetical protein